LHLLIVILTFLLMAAGLAGSLLPGLPGSPLILLGAFLYAWSTGFESVTWMTLLTLLILTLLSHALEFFSSALGVKKFGGTRFGMGGAILGGIVGLLLGGIFGLIVGTFLGALLLEIIHTRNMEFSLESGFGTLVGLFLGAIGKLAIGIIMIGIFLVKILA
jgi:uncharacterized protein YqgC (DUF456 family)